LESLCRELQRQNKAIKVTAWYCIHSELSCFSVYTMAAIAVWHIFYFILGLINLVFMQVHIVIVTVHACIHTHACTCTHTHSVPTWVLKCS
jgi:hypothetical protein